MIDQRIQAAADPSCLLALFPDRGGCWLSALRPDLGISADPGMPFSGSSSWQWYDLQAVFRGLGEGIKFRLKLGLAVNSLQSSGVTMLLGNEASAGPTRWEIALRQSDNTVALYIDGAMAGVQYLAYSGELTGITSIELTEDGATLTLKVNGETLQSYPHSQPLDFSAVNDIYSRFDGIFTEARLEDYDTGEVLWCYPTSTPERLRLISRTNLLAGSGAFAMALPEVAARISTQLDFRGNDSSKTFYASGYFPQHSDNGGLYLHPLISQGRTGVPATNFVFHLAVWEDYRESGALQLRGSVSTPSGTQNQVAKTLTADFFNHRHSAALVVDYGDGSNMALRLYLDGEQVDELQTTAAAFGNGGGDANASALSIRYDAASAYIAGNTVDCALVFDRALTAGEIAALG